MRLLCIFAFFVSQTMVGILNNELFFNSCADCNGELWSTDGTTGGTALFKTIHTPAGGVGGNPVR